MALGLRKVMVISLVVGIFLMANVVFIAHWLNELGAVEFANTIRRDFLTGTAITVIIALLILLMGPQGKSLIRRCPVCDHKILRGKYCGECGSRA